MLGEPTVVIKHILYLKLILIYINYFSIKLGGGENLTARVRNFIFFLVFMKHEKYNGT